MKVNELCEALGLETVCAGDIYREVTGGYCGDLLSWVMSRALAGNAWITIMCNPNTVAVALLAEVSAVIFAEGVRPGEDVINKAREQNITLLCSDQTAYELAGKLFRLLGKN